jgi:hypothetical protein
MIKAHATTKKEVKRRFGLRAEWPNEFPLKERLVCRKIPHLLFEGTEEYEIEIFRQILAAFFLLVTTFFIICFSANPAYSNEPEEKLYSLNIYTGQMTTNSFGTLLIHCYDPDFKNSYLTAVTLARRIGSYKKMASFELEGQIVKHFNMQNHWEINALITARWEEFPWDKYVDTSFAFGLGGSYATAKPEIEILVEGNTSRFLVYFTYELALGLPEYPDVALIIRIHHRSGAWGLVADEGGSNTPCIGLKYRF